MLEAAARYRANGWWRDETFLDDLRRNARDLPGRTAVIAYRVQEGTSSQIDYAELARLTGRFASTLLTLGVKRGDTVAAQLPSRLESLLIALACAQVGARFCPLMTIYRRYEMSHMLRLTGARVCITVTEWDGARLAEIVTGLRGELPELEHVIVAGTERPAGTLNFADYFPTTPTANEQEADFGDLALGPDEPFLILFTSGTTGEAKGVLHSQNTLYAAISAYTNVLGMDDSVVSFVSHAATHYTGLVLGLIIPVMLGCTAVIQDSWDPDHGLELIKRHGVTTYYGSPPYLLKLLAAQRSNPRDVAALSTVVTGSAPIPPHMVAEVRDLLGARLFALWGMSENGSVTMTRRDDPADWAAHSDGRPVDCMQIRIDTSAIPGSSDGSGKLWVRGATQCLGYYKRDEAYAALLDADGWFDTGDVARPDGRDGLRISGRVKDIVINRGFNVPVTEIEAILGRQPQVEDIAVIGLPDQNLDEVICAVIVPAQRPPSLDELTEYLSATGVTHRFWPQRLEIVDSLPRTVTGKVRKAELRRRFGPDH